jgi:hypothetical protein
MSLQNRETLKSYFRKGQLPSEGNFHDLIDSLINKVDDGMSKTVDDGLMLSPIGESKKLISFYKSIEDKSPEWRVEVNGADSNLCFSNRMGENVASFNEQGRLGINTEEPCAELEVNGVIAQKGRMGTAYQGTSPADGRWHKIIEGLNGCQMLEVVAGVGKKKTGKYALLHAMAVSTFGKSKNKVKKIQAHYGVRGNRIDLKWTGTIYDYHLEMRTKANYGENIYIQYNIQSLWQDTFMDTCFIEGKKEKEEKKDKK